ncbi:MAG TPA: M3 family oligoendopeptidase, partial [Myxococcota bacterium]|nr:M3 family oligoendopeptidase [Myxococcota bacterium]
EAARAEADAAVAKLPACRGTLGRDAATLLSCVEQQYAVAQQLGRLGSYTSNHTAADARDDAWQAREGTVTQLQGRYSEAVSWFDPEIIALGSDRLEAMLQAEPKLAPYAYPLRSVLRHGQHVLGAEEERVLALASVISEAPYDTYETLINAEVPWPEVTLPDGSKATLRQSEYERLRRGQDRDARRLVFDAFFSTLSSYSGTFGALLGTQVSTHWYQAQARHYGSSVEAALDGNFLPRAIYDTLVRETNANLPTLHRYFALRARLLGVEHLGYHDLYVPLVKLDKVYTIEDSKKVTLAACKPLGKAYTDPMAAAFEGGWMDVYPAPGKRSGAYMDDSAYGVHPFLLLNHNDDYVSASTFAHEWGHAMHSYLAMKAQPYATTNYATFLAEIASTFNEALLLDYSLANAKTDEERLFFLGNALESLRTTYFRQAMFAEFELALHDQVEHGEPLTGGTITATYADIVRRYHGQAEGVVDVEDVWTHEWAFIPHFYYDFYVWQYATSIAASSLLSDRVLHKEKGAVDAYLRLLEAGGSDDPHALLQRAGVDMTTAAPYRAVAARMDAIMDRIEAILAKQKK